MEVGELKVRRAYTAVMITECCFYFTGIGRLKHEDESNTEL
jgi:hypothetical protein